MPSNFPIVVRGYESRTKNGQNRRQSNDRKQEYIFTRTGRNRQNENKGIFPSDRSVYLLGKRERLYNEPNSGTSEYLSGNGPLVAVLTEALAQDNYKKCRDKGEKKKISDSRREVGKAIQMIHRYRDNVLAKIKNPVENETLEIDPKKAIKIEKIGFGEV